ncbi:hypothetical protein [Clostridium sp.]|uniref:hypothetical protein n=1 Tax=Clostridium sp. TaxID=1506 RepID=UPI00352211F7
MLFTLFPIKIISTLPYALTKIIAIFLSVGKLIVYFHYYFKFLASYLYIMNKYCSNKTIKKDGGF